MSVVEQSPMNMSRTYVTIAVIVLLCAAWLAYSQGWFNWSSSSYEVDGTNATTEQSIDQEKMNMDAVPVTQPRTNPAATPAN